MADIDAREERLDGLDEACDPDLAELVALWEKLARNRRPPLRKELTPFTLKKWLGHISIYEAVADGDFMIRLDGTAIVEITGEDWTARRASEVDSKYGSNLLEHVTDAAHTNDPRFHRMLVFQRRYFSVSRVLLPVRKSDGGPTDQVFLAMYRDITQPEE